MQEQLLVWAVSFLIKAVECPIDTGPAWPSSVHRSIRRSRALRFARGRRLQDACSIWRFCWLCNFYGGLWNVYALLILNTAEHDCACRSCVWVGLKCAFGFWPDCCFFSMMPSLIKWQCLSIFSQYGLFLCLFSSPTITHAVILQPHNFVFLNFHFFPLVHWGYECGCFKEHSEVKKEALAKLYWKRKETAEVWRGEKRRACQCLMVLDRESS